MVGVLRLVEMQSNVASLEMCLTSSLPHTEYAFFRIGTWMDGYGRLLQYTMIFEDRLFVCSM